MTSIVDFGLSATDVEVTHIPLGEIITGAKVLKAGSVEYPLLSMTMHHGLVRQEDKFKKRIASRDLSQYKVVSHGQLVVGFPIDEGVLSFQTLVDAGIVSPAYGVWDLRNPDAVDRGYLEKYLRSPQALSYYLAKLRGSTARRRSLPREVFLAMPIPLPSFNEQRRIAAILDKADGLRIKRRQALAQLADLPQSIFMAMFGDPIANDARLPVRELQTLLDENRPLTYGILMPGPDQEGGVKYVRVTDIQDGRIQESTVRSTTSEIAEKYRRSTLRPGDLIMSIRGHVGRFAVVPATLDGANITQDTARLAVSGAEVTYVRECLSTPGLQRWMARHTKGVAVRGINLGDVRRIPIPVAEVEKQQLFARRIESVERLQDHGRAHLIELEKLFAALQYRAFRGEA